MHEKVFVQVLVLFDEAGTMTPKSIRWEDGRVFSIDRILDIRPGASLKAGGRGIRYTCRILGKQTYLFFEDPAWFVERRVLADPEPHSIPCNHKGRL
ncbi:hypothetical protein [Bianquea renquensis]|uniref:Uncharacterized protein n=1 Tax=Bianquea renquensis TaxID=2763661 RepID=A0A926DUJ7_9FIRM|nr:hypothetical protein [Bianquea renquensis]